MLLYNLYCVAKPLIPFRTRLALRQLHAARLKHSYTHSWPIDPAADQCPDGWIGWPHGKQFAFTLTHDVEGRRGVDKCRQLADLEADLGFRSAFNFVPEGEYRVSESLRKFLTKEGFEVGVHDLRHDGSLYASWHDFKRAAQKINQYVEQWGAVGFRSGFMRHDLKWLDEINVLYDSSTFDTDPFEPQPDGVGTIFPFWVSQNGQSGYVEMPYTLPQDSTLFLSLRETSIDIWKRKLDWVAERGGLALVNVHPDYVSFSGEPHLGEYSYQRYRELLEYVKNRYARECWFALPKDIAVYYYQKMVPASCMNKRVGARQEVIADSQGIWTVPGPSANSSVVSVPSDQERAISCLQGKRMIAVSFSTFPGDPRPRRAAEAFVSAGMIVDIICLGDDQSPGKESFDGIAIDRVLIRKSRGPRWIYLWQYCSFLFIVFLKLAIGSLGRRYDIVHIHNMPDVLVFSALVPKLLGSKVILDLHDPMPELMQTIFDAPKESSVVKWMARLEKWSIAFADRVITVNRACEQLFASRSCENDKISVIMNSPDEKMFSYRPAKQPQEEVAKAEAPFVIMYHGTIVERNGLDLAVVAVSKVRQAIPSAELRIYGPHTPFLDKVMREVSEKGLGEAVQYCGPRRLEELVHAIDECDVGVIPNRRNIFTEINTPTRIFEYLALGKTVVAPRSPGIQSYFDDHSLVLFDLGDAEGLAAQLIWVATHPYEAFTITKRGQEVYKEYVWSKERQKLLHIGRDLFRSVDDGQ